MSGGAECKSPKTLGDSGLCWLRLLELHQWPPGYEPGDLLLI